MHGEGKEWILHSFPSRSACEIKAPFVHKDIYRGLHTAESPESHQDVVVPTAVRKEKLKSWAKVDTEMEAAGLNKGNHLRREGY